MCIWRIRRVLRRCRCDGREISTPSNQALASKTGGGICFRLLLDHLISGVWFGTGPGSGTRWRQIANM